MRPSATHTSAYVSGCTCGRGRACSTLWRRARALLLSTAAYVSIRQHTSAYVSIRQHTSAYVYSVEEGSCAPAVDVSIRQNTSAYASAAYVTCAPAVDSSICQHTSAYASAAYVSIRQHTRADSSIRQHTSAYLLSADRPELSAAAR
jgi:hypothetical protein